MSPKPQVSVRPAHMDEAVQIARWQLAMAAETEGLTLNLETVTSGVQHVFSHPDVGEYLLGCVDGEAVGCLLLLREWSDWRCGTVLWIHSLYVEPEHRRSGIFKAMYEHVKSRVDQDATLRGIRLYVDRSNQNAVRTYRQLGMDGEHYQTFEWMKDRR